ncbi:hypothetical protein U2F10_05530 [Leptothoe sp. EHU-05/26/07-4]
MTTTVRSCNAIQHSYGAQPDGSWVESYIDSDTEAVLFVQPIKPYKPTQTAADQVGLENGWCTNNYQSSNEVQTSTTHRVLDSQIQNKSTVSQVNQASTNSISSPNGLGVPFPIFFVLPSVAIFCLLKKLDNNKNPKLIGTSLLNGHSDIPEYNPVYLTADSTLTCTGSLSVPTETNQNTVTRNQTDMKGFQAPWDEPDNLGELDGTETEPGESDQKSYDSSNNNVLPESANFNRIQGMSLKEFKEKFSQEVDGNTIHWERARDLYYPQGIDARIQRFWQSFGSKKTDIAVYYVFGLTKGGEKGSDRRERYDICAEYISDWFKKNLPGVNRCNVKA